MVEPIHGVARRLAAAGLVLALVVTGLATPALATSDDGADQPRRVHAGQSIQAALDAAEPYDHIVVEAGTYAEQLTITTNGVVLIGEGATLVPPASPTPNLCSGAAGPDTEAGICVQGHDVVLADFVVEHRKVESVGTPVRDVAIAGFEVRGFSGADIALYGTRNVRVTGNRLIDGAQYGVLTAGSQHTRISGNTVSSTSGLLFIGICMDDTAPTEVADNSVSGYNIGLCLQTQGADVRDNRLDGNCIAIYIDPGIGPVVRRNHISTSSPACGERGPNGIVGIFLAGAVGADVRYNRIEGQRGVDGGVGLAVADAGPGLPVASGNMLTENRLFQNDVDLRVETTGTGNVFTHNRCTTSEPAGLCLPLP